MDSLFSRDKDITAIYKTHVDMVYRICFLMLKNDHDTEDAVSNVFYKFLRLNKQFETDEHIKAYLIVCAKNTCKNYFSNYYNKNVVKKDDIDKVHLDQNHELLSEILKLPSKYKVVIYMYYYEGYKSNEIADVLNEKETTIRTRLKVGREKLKAYLGGVYEK